MAESIQGLERLFRRVQRLHDRTSRDIERPIKAGAVYMLGSIERNFKAEGRPKRWTALAESTVRQRRKGKGRGGPKILTNFGVLKGSMSRRIRRTEAEVGTNAVQAKRQHYGYPKKAGRGHSKTPARPFVMFQNEDFDAIGMIFSRHVRS
jgi:phage virion morphogenesis protein